MPGNSASVTALIGANGRLARRPGRAGVDAAAKMEDNHRSFQEEPKYNREEGPLARPSRPAERKRRTREHVIADLSANHVERHALLCGFAVERIRMDYGIDLQIQTFDRRGQVENGLLFFQLKATDRVQLTSGGRAVSCRVERADLAYWLGEALPVILVLYDARAEEAYWLHLQAYFEGPPVFNLSQAGERVTLLIPRENRLDAAAMKLFARRKNAIASQVKRWF